MSSVIKIWIVVLVVVTLALGGTVLYIQQQQAEFDRLTQPTSTPSATTFTFVAPTRDLYLGQDAVIQDCTNSTMVSNVFAKKQGDIYLSDGKGGFSLAFSNVVYIFDDEGIIYIWRL